MKPTPSGLDKQSGQLRANIHVEYLEDIISDPAFNDTLGHDWSSEGGALTTGPVNSKRVRKRNRRKAAI